MQRLRGLPGNSKRGFIGSNYRGQHPGRKGEQGTAPDGQDERKIKQNPGASDRLHKIKSQAKKNNGS